MQLEIENLFEKKITSIATTEDPSHDILHFKRVVKTAKELCQKEKANPHIVIPAAWLHDLVIIPKNDPRRSAASQLSAASALEFLKSINYPEMYFNDIAHAIEAHSFSANIEPKTLEAKIIQDADRLDAIGAIGIARCFATAGLLKSSFYSVHDPFCHSRPIDDKQFTIDHFYKKLFLIADTLKTESAKAEGKRRAEIMKSYLSALSLEIEQ
jgi:uncharacterized protein